MPSSSNTATPTPSKVLSLRRAGQCAACGVALAVGDRAVWDKVARVVTCLGCAGVMNPKLAAPNAPRPPAPPRLERGTAGGSAAKEAVRRRARQAQRHSEIKQAHPILGRLALALAPEPDAGRSYASGARGEQILGRFLDNLHEDGVLTLHDRRVPRTTANIDHIIVASGGVWVVDAKRYVDKRPEVVRGMLRVAGRDRTELVTGLHKQLDLIEGALAEVDAEEVPVHGALCFVDADIGLLQRPFVVSDVYVVWPKALAKLLVAPGPFDAADRDALRSYLATRFRPAA